MWSPGEHVVLRGLVNERVWLAQSVIVVNDSADETALLLLPGAECAAPQAYVRGLQGDPVEWDRWRATLDNAWALKTFSWQTNRFLWLLEPQKYYATCYLWQHATDRFLCYYINFQLPYRRSPLGFDSLDLDLDLVIQPDYQWHWKDEAEYQAGVRIGGIQPAWADGILRGQQEILDRLHHRRYPLDGSWLAWRPDPAWAPPALPGGWERV